MTKLEDIITKDLLERLVDEMTDEEIGQYIEAEFRVPSCKAGTISAWRSKFKVRRFKDVQQQVMQVVNKRLKISVTNFDDMIQWQDHVRKMKDSVESDQEQVTIQVEYPDKWLGVAVIGDLHFVEEHQDLEMLLDHTEKILAAENVICVQVGDLLSNQRALTHRGKHRVLCEEVPLHVARHRLTMWFKFIASRMAAIVTGSHDRRSTISEFLDPGQGIADVIDGAYLNEQGYVTIRFNDDLEYNGYLMHEGAGFSWYHPMHPAVKQFKEDSTLDFVVFGHLHAGVASIEIPMRDRKTPRRAVGVLSGGYWKGRCYYSKQRGYFQAEFNTPILILNPYKKQIRVFLDLDEGLEFLKMKNGE